MRSTHQIRFGLSNCRRQRMNLTVHIRNINNILINKNDAADPSAGKRFRRNPPTPPMPSTATVLSFMGSRPSGPIASSVRENW